MRTLLLTLLLTLFCGGHTVRDVFTAAVSGIESVASWLTVTPPIEVPRRRQRIAGESRQRRHQKTCSAAENADRQRTHDAQAAGADAAWQGFGD